MPALMWLDFLSVVLLERNENAVGKKLAPGKPNHPGVAAAGHKCTAHQRSQAWHLRPLDRYA